MGNRETSEDRGIGPHSHSTTSENLVPMGTKHEAVKDGIGLTIGFRKIKVFKCKICTSEIREEEPNFFPIS